MDEALKSYLIHCGAIYLWGTLTFCAKFEHFSWARHCGTTTDGSCRVKAGEWIDVVWRPEDRFCFIRNSASRRDDRRRDTWRRSARAVSCVVSRLVFSLFGFLSRRRDDKLRNAGCRVASIVPYGVWTLGGVQKHKLPFSKASAKAQIIAANLQCLL